MASNKTFEFSGQEKKFSLIFLVIGVVLFGIGLITNLDHPTRLWSSLIYNNFFFLMISLCALFFVSANTIGYSGWFIAVRRVSEAVMSWVPIGAVLLLIFLALGGTQVYHWMDASLYDPNSANFDAIIKSKEWWLNKPFYWGRAITFAVVWSLCVYLIRRNSLQNDISPSLKVYQNSKYISAFLIVFFAVSSSMSSWDYMMSAQPHWYSTLWGWYTFISAFVTYHSVTMLILLHLRSKGYMSEVINDSHIHDVGKFMFGFSIAWAYLFYSQFMLIWYSNMPEETIYFRERFEHYPVIMYVTFVLNFMAPFFVLVTRGNKRNTKILTVMACVIIFGHWLDFYQMLVPGAIANMHHATGGHGGEHDAPYYLVGRLGFLDIGLALMYVGAASYWIFNTLSKASLLPENHPFAKETRYHQI